MSICSPEKHNHYIFVGKYIHSNQYLMFNNQIREFISTMGQDGEELLDILDEVEKLCGTKFDKAHLSNVATAFPKVGEYDRAIKAAPLN